MSGFAERAAQNEVLFRSVNEEIETLGEVEAGSPGQLTGFVCECSDATCSQQVHLTLAEYEEVRSDGRWFAVVPNHVTPEIEHVVRSTDRYMIVEKDTPQAVEIVERADPRD